MPNRQLAHTHGSFAPARVEAERLAPILQGIAKASHFGEQQWLELEAQLPAVRQECPEFYETLTELMTAAFHLHQAIEGYGDDVLGAQIVPPDMFQPGSVNARIAAALEAGRRQDIGK